MQFWPKIKRRTFSRRNISDFFSSKKDGIISGAADNDPSGIVTYLQVGATTGLSMVWLLAISTPMLIVVEEMSARVAAVTKKGLGQVLAEKYGIKLALFMVLFTMMANIATIGADIAGMGDILAAWFKMEDYQLLFVILMGLICTLFLLRGRYQSITRYLYLLTPVFLAYVVAVFIVGPDWKQVIHDIVLPHTRFNASYVALAVGMLGTTITPFVIFWETTEDVEQKLKIGDIPKSKSGIRFGMIYSNITAMFMIVLSSVVLGVNGGSIETLRQASEVLQPLVGNFAFALFSIGVLGAGFLALPVLASSTAYMLADVFRWKSGLDKQQIDAPSFYSVILLAMIFGVVINIFGISPIQMLVWSQIFVGLVVPFLVLVLTNISNDKKVMGEHVNSWKANTVAYLTIVVLFLADILLVFDWIKK